MIYYLYNKKIKANFIEYNDAKMFIDTINKSLGQTVSTYRVAKDLIYIKASGNEYVICSDEWLKEFNL